MFAHNINNSGKMSTKMLIPCEHSFISQVGVLIHRDENLVEKRNSSLTGFFLFVLHKVVHPKCCEFGLKCTYLVIQFGWGFLGGRGGDLSSIAKLRY